MLLIKDNDKESQEQTLQSTCHEQ